jgi:hypothetical protein
MKSVSFTLSLAVVLAAAPCGLCIGLGPNTQVDLGLGAWYFDYKEPGLMEEKGPFMGVHGACVYRGPLSAALQDCMIAAEARAGLGRVDYDGGLMDGTPYAFDGYKDILAETRGLMGYDLGSSSVRLTPFVGGGYRYLKDDGTASPYGYERIANYLYSPLGVEVLFRLNDVWRIGGTAEYDLFWLGRQKTLWGTWISDDQHHGYGVRGSLKLVRQGRKTNLILEPYVIYWDISQSDVNPIDGGYEPKNHSTETGVRVTLQL